MNTKSNQRKNQVKNLKKDLSKTNGSTVNLLSNQEIAKRVEQITKDLKSYTWRELETKGKFDKNKKLNFISDDMLILGCDIGSETHFIRGIDSRGRELSKKAFSFSNTEEGFMSAKEWAINLAAEYDKKQIVLGLEPTGHYWFCIAAFMVRNGISVVQVNPYAVKQTKELEDNSQKKDDRKDPKLIANLVKDGNFGMPYLPEGVYAQMRHLSMLREQLSEDKIRTHNRLHREMKIYFPEYADAFGALDGVFTLEVLKKAPFPEDIVKLDVSGIKEIWHEAKLRGRGYSRADEIVRLARISVGITEGTDAGRIAVQWFVEELTRLTDKLSEIESKLWDTCNEIPYAKELLGISGIGERILPGILSEMGDISRFDDAKELQKLGGLSLVECSSGKHKGETKISRRGRKRLRYYLYHGASSVVAHAEEFKKLHLYYTTRSKNPLKKMQSIMVIACKLLRIIYAILKKGTKYDPKKMLKDIKRQEDEAARTAA
jgi:transposase